MLSKTLALVSIFVSGAIAANDWSKPCFGGECSYDLPAKAGGPQGTLKIWSTNKNAITDITPAAGWVILSCDPTALEQSVRLICQGDESDINGCGNVFQSLGSTGKVVRLPENCGKNAFGRLAKISVDKDQTIPTNFASKLATPAGKKPVVRVATIDVNFKDVDSTQTGNVSLAVEGATYPGQDGAVARRAARSALFDKLAEKRDDTPADFVENAFSLFGGFDLSDSTNLTPINIDQTWTLFDFSISCPAENDVPAFTASATADIHVTANADVTIGVAAVGEVIPPHMYDFGLFVGLNANFDGQFQLQASASGTADTGLQEIFEVGLPGLDWPGILSVGPVFKVNGQATASLDVNLDLEVDLTYTLTNAQLFYPKSDSQSSGVGVSPGDSALSLSVSPSVTSQATVLAELQPRIDVGISAIAGFASATVSLSMDAIAQAQLSLNAATSGVNGCVDVTASLDMHAGADASFFDLFNPSTTVTLFNDSWDIYDKCWGNSRRSEMAPLLKGREIVARDISCPASNSQTLVPLT